MQSFLLIFFQSEKEKIARFAMECLDGAWIHAETKIRMKGAPGDHKKFRRRRRKSESIFQVEGWPWAFWGLVH